MGGGIEEKLEGVLVGARFPAKKKRPEKGGCGGDHSGTVEDPKGEE